MYTLSTFLTKINVTSINSTPKTSHLLPAIPTTVVTMSTHDQEMSTLAFMDSGSQRHLINPTLVKIPGLRSPATVRLQITAFGVEATSEMLDLVKVKLDLCNHTNFTQKSGGNFSSWKKTVFRMPVSKTGKPPSF